jgi:hypothetical protein
VTPESLTVNPASDLERVRLDFKQAKGMARAASVPRKLITSIETKALRTGRKQTGEHATNRQNKWSIKPSSPQHATERDCRIIFIMLCAMVFEFENAPPLAQEARALFESYLQRSIKTGTYKDELLLEKLDYNRLREDCLSAQHGYAVYHIGHQDPSRSPRHVPDNVGWRTSRSNLIQGDMTLREARIYLVKLIGRYFELGELEIG